MSEEEKKAIEELKSKRDYFKWQPEGCNWRLSFDEDEVKTIIDVVLNLIEKQQKEINEAIEYIENAKKELYGCGNYYLSDLLNILKGE